MYLQMPIYIARNHVISVIGYYKKFFCTFCVIGNALKFLAEDNHRLWMEKCINESLWYGM